MRMMGDLLHRSRVLLVLASLVAGFLMTGITPADAATKRTVTFAISAPTATAGTTIRMSGVLTKSPRRSRVDIQRYAKGKWRRHSTVKTTARGHFSTTVKTKGFGSSTYRARAPKNRRLTAATSKPRKLTVDRRTAATLSAPPTVTADQSFTLSGTVTPYRAGVAVTLEKYDGTSWRADGAATTVRANGTYSLLRTAGRSAATYRAAVSRSSAFYAAAASGTVTVTPLSPADPPTAPPTDPPADPPTDPPADTTAPPTPSGLRATPADGSIALSWDALAPHDAPDLAGYLVYRSTDDGDSWTALEDTPRSATSAVWPDLENGTDHEFVVTARDTAGNESPRSPKVSASPHGAATSVDLEPDASATLEVSPTFQVSAPAGAAGDHDAVLTFTPDSAGLDPAMGLTTLMAGDVHLSSGQPQKPLTFTWTFDEPLPEGSSGSFFSGDPHTEAYHRLPTTISPDRLSATAKVSSLSPKSFATWIETDVSRFAGNLFSTRGDRPECAGQPPTWVDETFFVDKSREGDNPLLVCLGHDPDDPEMLVTKITNNRGYGLRVDVPVDWTWIHLSGMSGIESQLVQFFQTLEEFNTPGTRMIVLAPGQQVDLGFRRSDIGDLDTFTIQGHIDAAAILYGIAVDTVFDAVGDRVKAAPLAASMIATCLYEIDFSVDDVGEIIAELYNASACLTNPQAWAVLMRQVLPTETFYDSHFFSKATATKKALGKLNGAMFLIQLGQQTSELIAALNYLPEALGVTVSIDDDDDAASESALEFTSAPYGLTGASLQVHNYGDAYTLLEDYTLEAGRGYYFSRPLRVAAGATLTIQPGARIKIGHCNWTIWWPAISCLATEDGGAIAFEGTKAAPIIVTRIADDSIGGDTDGTPPESSMAGTAPIGLNGGSITASHTEFRYAGVSAGSGRLALDHTRFTSGAAISGNTDSASVNASTFTAPVSVAGAVTVTRSKFLQSQLEVGQGTASIAANTFVASTVSLWGTGKSVSNNTFIDVASPLRADPTAASGAFTGNTVHGGRLSVAVSNGTIDTDMTWASPVTYLLNGDITVAENARLTVGAGAVLKNFRYYGNYGSASTFTVNGTLNLNGTAARKIVWTNLNDNTAGGNQSVPDAGSQSGSSWRGITTGPNAHLTLTHTDLRGAEQLANLGPDTHAKIAHSTLRPPSNANYYGWLSSISDDLTIEDTRFVDATVTEARANTLLINGGDPQLARVLFDHTGLTNNSPDARVTDAVFNARQAITASPRGAGAHFVNLSSADDEAVTITVTHGTIDTDTSWASPVTYLLNGDITVAENARLTVGAGAVLKNFRYYGNYGSASTFTVNGTLNLNGTAARKIVWTNLNDNTAGGNQSVPDAGSQSGSSWRGITTGPNAHLTLTHTDLRGASQVLNLGPDTRATITHSTATHEPSAWQQGAAIRTQSHDFVLADSQIISTREPDAWTYAYPSLAIEGGTVTVTGTEFVRSSVYATGGTSTMTRSRFTDNAHRAVTVLPGAVVDARLNWWGQADGPARTGTSSSLEGAADVSPWCAVADCSDQPRID